MVRCLSIFFNRDCAILEIDDRAFARVGQAQDGAAQFCARHVRRFAGDKSLARGGSLAAVGRDRGIAGNQIEAIDGSAQRVGANLSDDGVRALSDIHRALVQRDAAVGFQSDANGGRIGQGSVAAAVPHAGDAHAAPERAAGLSR